MSAQNPHRLTRINQPNTMMNASLPVNPPQLDDPLHQMTLQLHAAQAELLEVRRTQAEFLSAMGHELRSPLTAVIGYAQLLEFGQPASAPGFKSGLTHILQAGWDLLDLINELLDASLVECGKLQLQMQSVCLDDVLRDCGH